MSAFRALPSKPSLEFERKEAKALLRALRARNGDAITRAHARHPVHNAPREENPSARGNERAKEWRLADAQLIIAREYGFASWARLGRYFRALERIAHRTPTSWNAPLHSIDAQRESVRRLITAHAEHQPAAARTLAAYVPRLNGLSANEVFAVAIEEAEAELAVARRSGYPSWEVLLEHAAGYQEIAKHDGWDITPLQHAWKALRSGSLDALREVVQRYPQLLQPNAREIATRHTLMSAALQCREELGAPRLREILNWLETQGFALQRELNEKLCGHMYMKPTEVQSLLDQGADANWIAPNGISALEHAVVRYWSSDALDVLAEHATAPPSLWLGAGLGDVDMMRNFLTPDGRPTARARASRPDFLAIGAPQFLSMEDATDEEVLSEAFLVAFLNGRVASIEYLVARGFPVDWTFDRNSPLWVAVGNAWVPMVESLLKCGANPEFRTTPSQQTPREMARDMLRQFPDKVEYRRTAELCGIDVEQVLAALNAERLPAPSIDSRLQTALELASDDAARLGEAEVSEENLLFGLLRLGALGLMYFTRVSQMDFERFQVDMQARVRPVDDRPVEGNRSLSTGAAAALEAATDLAAERRRDAVSERHLLYVLLDDANGVAARLLREYGSSADMLRLEMQRAL